MFTICVVYLAADLTTSYFIERRTTHYEGKFETIEEVREATESIGRSGVWVGEEERQLILPHHMIELSIKSSVYEETHED